MENSGLLFIPDISGFTKFVNETDIEHSRLIIKELLEILINANDIGLEISEVEGDAILFYKFGTPPELQDLYVQVEKMFSLFHKSLAAYNLRKYCQCKACLSAANLSLKIITHYGEFSTYNVKTFTKLIGKGVITAHQLLKNDIEQHEYWLLTESLLKDKSLPNFTDWMKWGNGSKKNETDEVLFHYTQLSPLKQRSYPEPVAEVKLPEKAKLFSVSQEYHTDIITLFHATGDFSYRHKWREGVKEVKEVGHFLPRIGMKCQCVYENGEVITYSNSYSYHPDKIEFSETDEHHNTITYYTLEKLDDSKVKLTVDFYQKSSFLWQALFMSAKKREMAGSFSRSLRNIEELVKEIRLPPSSV